MISLELKVFLEDMVDVALPTINALKNISEEDMDLTENTLHTLGSGYLILYSCAVTDNLVKDNYGAFIHNARTDNMKTETKIFLRRVSSTCARMLKERIGLGSEGLSGDDLSLYNLNIAFMHLYKHYRTKLILQQSEILH